MDPGASCVRRFLGEKILNTGPYLGEKIGNYGSGEGLLAHSSSLAYTCPFGKPFFNVDGCVESLPWRSVKDPHAQH